jgi:hypothetical protein
MKGMGTDRKFSLGYFFVVVALCLVVLAFVGRPVGSTQRDAVIAAFGGSFFVIFFCAAVGGTFNRLKAGAVVGLVLGAVVFLPLITIAITGGA